MIVSMRYVMRGVVFGHNQRSITVILGQISISLELPGIRPGMIVTMRNIT